MVEQIIMRSGTRSVNNLNFESIVPTSGESFPDQVQSCIAQLCDFVHPKGERRYYVAQQTFFINTRTWDEYEERSEYIREQLDLNCEAFRPATGFVAQNPSSGSEVVLELICTRSDEVKEVRYSYSEGNTYAVVDYGHFKVLHATGLMGERGDTLQQAAEKAFTKATGILGEEGLSIHHIIRQWNYVENIFRVEAPGSTKQNYQIFNDVRSRFYETGSFSHGYPAATGIGMNTGGVIIGFIAVSDSDEVEVKPIRNPRQIDAHRYSENVLVGDPTGIAARKCTPKFERGKMLVLGGRNHIYVSGTASIVGEKTMYPGDVKQQTITTIENIFQLFSEENQKSLGLDFDISEIRFSHLRVYVKNAEDIPEVRKICESRLSFHSSIYLESDICREELLVEIEGIFTLSDSR